MKRYTIARVAIDTVCLALALNSALAGAPAELPAACQSDCAAPYGKVLGISRSGIEAYSNCNSACVVYEPNYHEGTYTGIKWQCVEYARRWLLVNRGAVYGDVDVAADIWDGIDYLTEIATHRKLPLESRLNGSRQPPRVGDLLVYARAFHGTGHVAVVVGVDAAGGHIAVAEQNYDNEPWPGGHSRQIELIRKGDRYWLLDADLLGWKHARFEEQPHR